MRDTGYDFYFAYEEDGKTVVLRFPITPGELKTKIGSNNKVVTLIDEGDINILKSPSLIEVEFTARFPMRFYPYAKEYVPFETYFTVFKKLKETKQPFRFIVARRTPIGQRTWDTNIQMALESCDLNENADEGDDVLIDIQLKQYKPYGVKVLNTKSNEKKQTTSTSSQARSTKTSSTKNHTIKSGDCLWNIAKKYYGDGSKWTVIYNANKNVIESTAKKYRGGKGSSNGHWIYPGTKLTIPEL